MTLRSVLKRLALAVATVAVAPALASYALRKQLIGANRALEGSTQALALWPGIAGQYLRRAFLSHVLAECAASATVEFGTIFSQVGARIGEHAYIGPRCHIGLAHIQRNVLIAAGVHIPSGRHTHVADDVSTPIRDQAHQRLIVTIGEGSWIGSGAVVMADVGANTIVGAGAVVASTLPACVVAAGVPARVLRNRSDTTVGA